MAKCKVTLSKKGSGVKAAAPAKVGDVADSFVLLDNQDNTLTVQGVSKAGNPVDISRVATIAVTSDSPAILTVDAPTGMTVAFHAVGPVGTANLTIVATWNDPAAGIGPFTIVLPGTVKAGPANSLVIDLGTPTSH